MDLYSTWIQGQRFYKSFQIAGETMTSQQVAAEALLELHDRAYTKHGHYQFSAPFQQSLTITGEESNRKALSDVKCPNSVVQGDTRPRTAAGTIAFTPVNSPSTIFAPVQTADSLSVFYQSPFFSHPTKAEGPGHAKTRSLYPNLVIPKGHLAPYDASSNMKLGCVRCNRHRNSCDMEAPCGQCIVAGDTGEGECRYTYKEPFAKHVARTNAHGGRDRGEEIEYDKEAREHAYQTAKRERGSGGTPKRERHKKNPVEEKDYM